MPPAEIVALMARAIMGRTAESGARKAILALDAAGFVIVPKVDGDLRDKITVAATHQNPYRAADEILALIAARRAAAAKRIATLEGALRTMADELESEIEARYPPEARVYPSEQRRYNRDMSSVLEARAALNGGGNARREDAGMGE